MRLISINLKNYRKYEEERVDFPDGLVGIIGPNGSGKSSLMESIAWTLYGNSAARTAKEGIKKQGASSGDICEAVLELELGGTNYQVVRELRGKEASSDAAVYVQRETLARGSRPTLEYVHKMLGMDREAFFTSYFAKQNELNTLSDLTPAERKTLITRMLGINRVDEALELLKKDLRAINIQINTLSASLADPNRIREEISLEKERIKKAREVITSREIEERNLKQEVVRLKQALQAEEKKKEKHTRLTEKYKVNRERLKEKGESLQRDQKEFLDLKSLESSLKEKKPQIFLGKAEKELTALREGKIIRLGRINHLREEQEKLVKNLERVEKLGPKGSCPTCLRPLGEDLGKIKNHFSQEIKAKQEKIEQIEEEIAGFRGKIKQKEEEVSLLKLEQEKVLKIETQLKRLGSLESQIERIKREVAERRKVLAEIKREGLALNFSPEKHEEKKKNYDRVQESYRQASHLTKDAIHEVELLKMGFNNLEKALQEYQEKKKEIKKLLKKQENLGTLQEVLTSFRIYLIGRVRPVLSQKASRLLSELTDGKYGQLELDDDYEVFLYDQGEKFPLARFSGGEKDLANLCLRLAVSELMTEASHSDFGFIILDEIVGSQDPVRKGNIMRALARLSTRFRQIFLITHVEEVKDSMEYVLTVSEDESGSSHLALE